MACGPSMLEKRFRPQECAGFCFARHRDCAVRSVSLGRRGDPAASALPNTFLWRAGSLLPSSSFQSLSGLSNESTLKKIPFKPVYIVQFSAIKYIYIVLQPSPQSICRVFHHPQQKLYLLHNNSQSPSLNSGDFSFLP